MNRVLFSSASDHWATPADTYDALNKEFGFTFDPCPLMADFDGLRVEWGGRVFCNPPYSDIPGFLRKGLGHLAAGTCELIVYLLPARTDTRWFHDYCMKASEIRFLRGRLKFGDAKFNAPFPSMAVIFREWKISRVEVEIADSLKAMQKACKSAESSSYVVNRSGGVMTIERINSA